MMSEDSSQEARRWASRYKAAIGIVVVMIATAAFILILEWMIRLGNEVVGVVF